jgi:excisionase family DNA binding protein
MNRTQRTLGIREAAQRLGFTMKYVYDLVYAGKLQAEKVGNQWRIPAEAVEARMKQRGK